MAGKGIRLLCFLIIAGFLSGCRTSFPSLFKYNTQNYYCFSTSGEVIPFCEINRHPRKKGESDWEQRISAKGTYQLFRQDKLLLEGAPGDYLFPVEETRNACYIRSEKDCDFYRVLEFDQSGNLKNIYGKADMEAYFVLVSSRLHAVVYLKEKFVYDFFDEGFKALHYKLADAFGSDNIFWREHAPDGNLWIAEILFPQKPSIFLLIDRKCNSWKILSKNSPLQAHPQKKKLLFPCKVSDGVTVSGILSFPEKKFGTKKLPLIVFPHGGPQSCSTLVFDPRVEMLTSAGFLVYQPNYRGSTNYGKHFRQAGWRANGIKRALDDIAECTMQLINEDFADSRNVFIFGGSWGGYCALASITLYPQLFKGCVSFFGASNLPTMLQEKLPASGHLKSLDFLQYGNIKDVETVKNLKKLSPYYNTKQIQCPVMLFHFYGDDVLSYAQSETFFKKMRAQNKKIYFVNGDGKHGFADSEQEYAAYEKVIKFFRALQKNPNTLL